MELGCSKIIHSFYWEIVLSGLAVLYPLHLGVGSSERVLDWRLEDKKKKKPEQWGCFRSPLPLQLTTVEMQYLILSKHTKPWDYQQITQAEECLPLNNCLTQIRTVEATTPSLQRHQLLPAASHLVGRLESRAVLGLCKLRKYVFWWCCRIREFWIWRELGVLIFG